MSSTTLENSAKSKVDAIKPFMFKKGQSGNTNGRPKIHFDFVNHLREWLQGKTDGDTTRLQECLENLKENKPEILLAYCYGKPTEHIKIEGDANPLGTLAVEVARLLVAQQVEKLQPSIEVKQIETKTNENKFQPILES